MGSVKFFTLKEARLSNNCPECYSKVGLEITFRQKFTENTFYKAITNETSHELFCFSCNTPIFPIQWTDDIERVIAYQHRAIIPKSKSLKLKSLAWVIITSVTAIIALIVLMAVSVISF
jgi:hypothetical protein